jgi:hypothetical protein
VLTEEMRAYAVERDVDADEEFAAWRDDCAAHGRRYRDWEAAWRTRIRNVPKFGAARQARLTMSPAIQRLRQIGERINERARNVGTTRPGAGDLVPAARR